MCTWDAQALIDEDVKTPWPQIGNAFALGTDGLFDAVGGLATQLLNECTAGNEHHVGCAPFDEAGSILPARVLDIGEEDVSIIKLYISKEGETGRYCALSWCWGGVTPTTTTEQNIQCHIERIPGPLPKTFRDSIRVTRALGVRYLWIDSLCILQDSAADWATHAPQMAAVYGNSYVTISADAAEDSTVGFLDGPNRYRFASKSVPFACGDQEGVVLVRERGALAYQLPYHDWPIPLTPSAPLQYPPKSLLSTRGWVFQERILSPRTLHFGKAELGFECRSMITCECSATSKRYRRTSSLLKRALMSMSWYYVVVEYTGLQLTKQTDRLAALSGLVAARQLLRGEEIRYGMLMTDLERGLIWQSSISSIGKRLAIAPTWSWASTTAAIAFPPQWSDEMKTPPPFDWRLLGVFACPYLNSSLGRGLLNEELVLEGRLLPLKKITSTGLMIGRHRRNTWGTQILNVYWDTNESAYLWEDRCTLFIATGPPEHPKGLILEDLPDLHSPLLSKLSRGRSSIASPHVLPHFRRVGCVRAFPAVKNDTWSGSTPSEDVALEKTPVTWDWKRWTACSTRQPFAII